MMQLFETRMEFPKSLYTSAVILKAAYAFLGEAYFHIEDGGESWVVSLAYKNAAKDNAALLKEFENEIISQEVRERVAKGTKTIREMLMARALSSTVVDTENPVQRMKGEDASITEGELGRIMRSWYETNEND